MTEASPKLGGLRPISLQLSIMCFPWVLMRHRIYFTCSNDLFKVKLLPQIQVCEKPRYPSLRGKVTEKTNDNVLLAIMINKTPVNHLKLLNETDSSHNLYKSSVHLCSRPLSLSPTLTTITSLPEPLRLAISLLMALATPEWMAPQSPRSDVTPTIKCLAVFSSGALMSAFSYRAGEQKRNWRILFQWQKYQTWGKLKAVEELWTYPGHPCHKFGLVSAASQHERIWQQPPFSWTLWFSGYSWWTSTEWWLEERVPLVH